MAKRDPEQDDRGSRQWTGESSYDDGRVMYGQRGGAQRGREYGASERGRQQSFRGLGPKGYERSDERIKEIVCEMLTDDENIDASGIVVEVVSGEVILEGTVDDRRTKYEVEELIGNLSGVKDIRNQLRVSGQSPLDLSRGGSGDKVPARKT